MRMGEINFFPATKNSQELKGLFVMLLLDTVKEKNICMLASLSRNHCLVSHATYFLPTKETYCVTRVNNGCHCSVRMFLYLLFLILAFSLPIWYFKLQSRFTFIFLLLLQLQQSLFLFLEKLQLNCEAMNFFIHQWAVSPSGQFLIRPVVPTLHINEKGNERAIWGRKEKNQVIKNIKISK